MRKLERLNSDSYKKQRLIFGIFLAVLVIAYNFIWLNRSFTMSEGWVAFYVGLMDEGKIPYRDFYYFLPPLNLLIDYVIWKISGGYFFIYRLIRLAERVLIVELMYKQISKKVDPFISAVGSILATVLASASGYDLVGDYNQTMQLLVVLLCLCVIKYTENLDCLNKKWKWIFLAGIIGGCLFLSKQTIIVSSGIVFSLFVLFLVITKKEKNIFKMILSVFAGFAVPMGICGIYLIYTRSLTEFLNQVFLDTSSKGGALDLIFLSQTDMISTFGEAIVALAAMAAAYSIAKKADKGRLSGGKNLVFLVLIALSAGLLGSLYFTDTWFAVTESFKTLFSVVFIIFSAAICLLDLNKLYSKFIVFISGIICVLLLLFDVNGCSSVLYNNTASFSLMNSLVTLIHFALVTWVISHIVKCLKHKTEFDLKAMTLVCGSIASGWATSMSSGMDALTVATAFLSVPTLTYILFKNRREHYQTAVKSFIIFSLACVCVCGAQKAQCPYTWWGDSEASFTEKTETSDIRALKGFKFSKQEKKKYDDLNKLIDENTDEDSVIFGFPYVKVYNVFLENYNMDNFVPVLFYDVCSDAYAESDAKILSKNQPDIVVWHDIDNCMEVHEELFRDGEPLGQRKIQKWFSSAVKTDYELIGQVEDVFVYKLKNGEKPKSTFIERKTAKNKTISSSNIKKGYISRLEGKGTVKNPYKISSASDLKNLRNLVNEGVTFEDKYIVQTADIDLSEVKNWKPIGTYKNSAAFSGTYDGNGYSVKNLTATGENDNGYLGLFGFLNGTVKNVSVINCNINGVYAGGLVSHASKNSEIINCFVSGKITAAERASGIVDNSYGKVYNCAADCELESNSIGGISGYYYSTVENCYSNYGGTDSVDDGYKLAADSAEKLNDGLKLYNKKNRELCTWEKTENSLKLLPVSE